MDWTPTAGWREEIGRQRQEGYSVRVLSVRAGQKVLDETAKKLPSRQTLPMSQALQGSRLSAGEQQRYLGHLGIEKADALSLAGSMVRIDPTRPRPLESSRRICTCR